mgnify:FL=1
MASAGAFLTEGSSSSSRTFLVDVDDGTRLRTLRRELINELADEAHLPWEFGNVGFVTVDDHEVTECENDATSDVPVIRISRRQPK